MLADYDLWVILGPQSVFVNKAYWNTAIPIHLHVVYVEGECIAWQVCVLGEEGLGGMLRRRKSGDKGDKVAGDKLLLLHNIVSGLKVKHSLVLEAIDILSS